MPRACRNAWWWIAPSPGATTGQPKVPWERTIVYEAHVKGLTKLRPDIPEWQRGTYAALGSAPVIEHLQELGVTAVELMPVHAFVQDRHLLDQGLRNYWGYNTIGFFAPEPSYLSPLATLFEFKTMVRRLHAAGLEVILDVVYNHTAEGNHLGPTLSFKGIDNLSYYRTVPDDPRYYMDVTGTGNSLNLAHSRVLQMVMDSLRYWVEDMHIDGFRFDLATTLGRERDLRFDPGSSFFDAIRQDPVLARVKLIAEPWDVGEGGYRLGGHGPGWAEWNDRYRDTVRSYWKGDEGKLPELATRLVGSADLFDHQGRRAWASVNFVAAHDGFTLHDTVSYNDKHNEANGEGNRDGHSHNLSWNCGVEGPTDDPLDPRPARAAEAQHAGHRAARPRHAHDPDGRRAGALPARQQQRLLPGQCDLLARLGQGRRRRPQPHGLRGPPDGAPALASSARQLALSQRCRGASRACGTSRGSLPRATRWTSAPGRTRRPGAWA